ncbi:MAG: hypothetical protein HY303_15395 [Candidatus Wallbacteria bacterium]|nr:hypothetical protein [Candidatus Wallbacteria bacterium]
MNGPTVTLTYSANSAAVPVDAVNRFTITATFSSLIVNTATPTISIGSTLSSQPGLNTVAATSMSPTAQPTVWTFTYANGIRSGNDGPFLVSVTGARDIAGNPNKQPAINDRFVVASGTPSVYLDYSQGSQVNPPALRAGVVIVTATFTEPITPTAPKIVIAGAAPVVSTPMSATTTLTVWTYPWAIPAGQNGNASVSVTGKNESGTQNSLPPFNSSVLVDTTNPTVSYTYSPSTVYLGKPIVTTDTVTVQAVFNEPLAATPAFVLQEAAPGVASVNSNSLNRVTASTWTATFPIAAGQKNGRYVMHVSSALDAAGNPTTDPGANSDLLIDTQQPQVSQLVYSKDISRPIGSGSLTVTATFNEALKVIPTMRILQIRPQSGRLLPGVLSASTTSSIVIATFTLGGADEGDWRVSAIGGADFAGNTNLEIDLSRNPPRPRSRSRSRSTSMS